MLITRVDKKSNNTTFGWKHSTHQLATEILVDKVNTSLPRLLKFNQDILKHSCIEPDRSRQNITKYVHGHFADIDNLSTDPPDALALARIYTRKALAANQRGMYGKRDDYMGYALHFVQDMLNPMHIEFVPYPKGHPERLRHKSFEATAQREQNEAFYKAFTRLETTSEPFFDVVLPRAMRKAKTHLELMKKGKLPERVARESLQNTFRTTYNYLQAMVVEMHNQQNTKRLASRSIKKSVPVTDLATA